MVTKFKADTSQVDARLSQLAANGGDVKAAISAFGSVVLNRIRLGFRMGRSPWGAAWAQLLLRKGSPLRDSGRLQRSITMAQVPDGVLIGTNLVQARVHQFGATIKPKNAQALRFPGPGGFIFAKKVTIPARPFMPLTSANQVDLPPQWTAAGLEAMKRAMKL